MKMPQVMRYLRALEVMAHDADPDYRAYALQMYRDMAVPGVTVRDCLNPVMVNPVDVLVGAERRHKLLAESTLRFALVLESNAEPVAA